MCDNIKIDNLIENMKELEVEEQPEEPQQPVVKEKRRYRSKFFYMNEEEIKAHKAETKRKCNVNYRLNHYDKIREAQTRYFSSDKGRDYMRDWKGNEAKMKKEAKLQELKLQEPINI